MKLSTFLGLIIACFIFKPVIVLANEMDEKAHLAISITYSETNVSCFGGNNGSIDITVSGGTAPYTFLWSNSENTEDLNNLTAGTYTVTVTDNLSETSTATIVVSQPSVLFLTTTQFNVPCNGGSTGSIDLTVTGGVAPYTYDWGGGQPTTQDRTSLASGTYTVTVTDANNCIKTTSATITEPNIIELSTTQVDVLCNGASTGSINLTVTGGISPFSYNWGAGQPTTQDRINLAASTYTVTVTDANNCSKTTSTTITQPSAILLSTTQVNVLCNGASTGSIDLTVTGGVSPYSYNWGAGQPITQDRTDLAAGTYTVTVTDFNNCTKTISATITQPVALILNTTQLNVSCNGGNNGAIDLTVTGGVQPYTYNWGAGQPTTQDRSGLAVGTYTVTVTDANACSSITSVTITQPAALALSTTQVNVLCNGASTGSIDLTVTGGVTPYSYNWGGGQPTTQDRSNLAAGTYNVTVSDANNCTATTSVTITQPTALALSTTQVNVLCFGASTGSIDLMVTGGVTPYTYNWGAGQPTTQDRSNLAAGTYNVTVSDANNCTATTSVTITQQTALALSTTQVNVLCFGASTGSIDLMVTGSVAPYTYNWGAGQPTTQDRSNLAAGTYNVTVTDANNCTKTTSVTITQPSDIALSVITVNSTCGNANGSINLTVTGGVTPYTYNWGAGQPTTQDRSGLMAGTYNVTVTDANDCTKTISANISNISGPSLSATQVNVLCNGASTGSIDLMVIGGTAPYNYNWGVGQPTTQDRAGLAAGIYTVTVTDANNCTVSTSATITEPNVIALNTTQVNVLCNGASTGSIDLTVAGGISPYNYNWGAGQPTSQDRINLVAGTYTVTVTDANNCSKTISTTITQPTALLLSATQVNVLCNGASTGSIDLTVTGGTAPYTYNWGVGQPTTQDRTDLAAGTYSVTVTDANGCTKSTSSSITEPSALVLSVTSVNATCGNANGSIDLSVTGGISPYIYNWGVGQPTTQDRTGLFAGDYTVTVTDANNCTKSISATVNNSNGPNLSTTQVNVLCNGGNNGSIDLIVTGGAIPYTYNWGVGQPTTQDRSNLAAGTYTVTVTDVNNCTISTSVTITEPNVITLSTTQVNVLCNGASTGSIDLTVTGGVSPYTYNWGLGQPATQNRTDLPAGTYAVTVTDFNACTKSTSVTITQPTALVLSSTQVNVLCNGASTGSINLTVTGGVSPYSYNWGVGQPTTQDRTDLPAGTYTVTVTDANNCTKTTSATITESNGLVLSTTQVNVLCNGASTGSIDLTVAGGVAPYTYNWGAGQPTTQDRTSLTAGTYTVTVTDNNSCSKIISATITEPNALTLSTTQVNVLCNGASTGSIDLIATGGVSPYTYNWGSGQPTTQDRSNLAAGTYTVTVKDVNNCSVSTSVTITEPSVLDLSTTQVNVLCNGASTGSIDLTVTGGVSPYTYNWGLGQPTTQDRSGLTAGIYTVTVTDANNCTKTTACTITEPNLLVLFTTQINVLCNGASTGSIDLTVIDGISPYTYNWGSGQPTTQDRNNLVAGTYIVTVTDSNNCTKSTSVTITQPTALLLSTTQVNVLCNGASTGSIDLTVTGGISPYVYNWGSGQPTTQDRTNLVAGTYNVTVTDANACTKTTSVTITQPTALSLSTTQVNVLCNGASTGSIDLTVTGGIFPYLYNWGGGQPTTQDRTNLVAGTYTVTVTDANACTKTTSVTIVQPNTIALSTTQMNILCNGASTGSIDLIVTGGVSPYTYNWGSGQPTTQDRSNLAAGTYSVTVTDTNFCTKTTSITITEPPVLIITTVTDKVKCYGASTGSIDLTVVGGVSPYLYNWGVGQPTTQDRTSLIAGTYTVTVTDANGCSKSKIETVTQNPDWNASIENTENSGNSPIDKKVCSREQLILKAFPNNYEYLWDNDSTYQIWKLLPTVTKSYTVTVTDGNGCTKLSSTTIEVLKRPTADFFVDDNDINYNASINGYIPCVDNSAPGDVAIKNWNWNFVSTNKDTTINRLNSSGCAYSPPTAGELDVKLKLIDFNNCKDTSLTTKIIVGSGLCKVNGLSYPSGNFCFGDSILVTASPGDAPGAAGKKWYWYIDDKLFYSGPNYQNIKVKFDDANKIGNKYEIKVYFVQYTFPNTPDSCISDSKSVNFTVNPRPKITFEVDKNEVCSGQKVKLKFGLSSNESYTLSGTNFNFLGGQTPNASNNYFEFDYPSGSAGLTAPTTFVLLSAKNDSTSCITTYKDTITVNVNPNPKLENVIANCTPQNDGYKVSYDITSGTSPYSLSLNGDSITNSGITNILDTNIYTLNVVDSKGCTTTITKDGPNCVCQFTNSTLKENIFNVCLGDNFNFEAIKNDTSPPAGYAVQYVLLDSLGNTISLVPVIYKGTDFFKTPNFPFSSLSNVKVDSLYRVRAITGLYTNDKFDPDDTCLDTILGPKVYFRSLPKALFAFDPDTVCAGKPVKGHLKFQDYPNNSKEIEFKENDTPPGTSITWNTRDTMFDRNYFVKGIQEFKVIKITDKVYNCISNDTLRFFLKVDSLPNSAISSMPVCEGQTLEIKTNVKPSYTYEWKKDNTIFSSNNQLNLPSSGIKDYGTYALTITDGNGCSNSNSIIIDNKKIQTTPTPSITTEVAPCDNAYDVIYTANGSPTDSAFVWTVSGGDSLYQILDSVSVHWKKGGAPREITVVVTSTAGCTSNPVTIPAETETEEAPDVAEILWAPDLHLLVCQKPGLCYQWGKSIYDSNNRIVSSTPIDGGKETAQAYYLQADPNVDPNPNTSTNTLYWVDIWSCNQANPCKTRCYFKRTLPKGGQFGPIPGSDFNGSDTSAVQQQKLVVNIYPNPMTDLMNLDVACPVKTVLYGQLYLPDGRMVLDANWDCKAGDNKLQIQMGQLQAGLYFLVLKESESAETVRKPIVIQH